jgi:hypothetical protein
MSIRAVFRRIQEYSPEFSHIRDYQFVNGRINGTDLWDSVALTPGSLEQRLFISDRGQ